MKILWLVPTSKKDGEYPLVGQNRWFKYLPMRTNFIYPEVVAYGCTLLKNAGFNVTFLDAPAEKVGTDDLVRKVEKENYDLIITEGRTAIINHVWNLIKLFHNVDKDVLVALHGDHVMCRPQESLDKGADYIISCGDYDFGALKLAQAINNLSTIPRDFTFPNMKDLSSLPFIDRDLVNWHNYYETWRHREEFGWSTSGRGCSYGSCTYCSWNFTFFDFKQRTLTPENAVERIEQANQHYGIKEFLDDADTFLAGAWGKKYANEIIERNLDIFWNVQTKSDVIARTSDSALKIMKESGLHIVKLGVDAWNTDSLIRVKKRCTMEDTEIAVKKLKNAGLEVHVNMVIGYPWESKKVAYDGLKWVKRLKPNQAQFSLLQPYIGTSMYDAAVENNWFDIDPNDYDLWDAKRPIVKGLMTADEIRKLYADAWHDFYFDPAFVTRQLGKAVRLCFHHKNTDALRHLWRGYKGVKEGHMKAMDIDSKASE